jgi:hypothetical protein
MASERVGPSAADVRALVGSVVEGAEVVAVRPLGSDAGAHDATEKALGYGAPVAIDARMRDGTARRFVLHTAVAGDFGHERRADRAAEMLLAFDTFGGVPRHVAAVDVGALVGAGFTSLARAGEFYLLTTFADGHLYAEDLRRIAATRRATDEDEARVVSLARYLVALHAERRDAPTAYVRAIRDLVGHGEGIYGLIDGYPADVPRAPPARLEALERRAAAWRWRLRGREARLCRTHGDFHPYNLVFSDDGSLSLLDASRGSEGDPADDVTCLAINLPFFALGAPGAWEGALRGLWQRFWAEYLDGSGDGGLLEVAPPFLAWRALVLANPRWYPAVDARDRDRLLAFAERALDAGRLELGDVEALFA